MELNEMKNIWERQEGNEQKQLTKEELVSMVKESMTSFDKKIKKRDWREIIVALLIAIGCIGLLFFVQSLWYQLGCVTLIFACGIIIYRLRSVHFTDSSRKLNPDRSFKEHLYMELLKLENQKKLLNSMLWWYLLPIFVGIVFFVIGFTLHAVAKIIYLGVVITLYGYIWKLNQDAVSKYIDPMLADIQDAITFIKKQNE